MVHENLSQRLALLGHLTPAAARASGSYATGWVDTLAFPRVLATLAVGTLAGAATINMRFQDATASDGTGSADIDSTNCITATYTSASNDKYVRLELRADQNQAVNRFVRAYITLAVSTWIGAVVVEGEPANYAPASDFNHADLVATTVF